MAVPPRSTEDRSSWEVAGERPVRGRRHGPDRAGAFLLAAVLVAVIIAVLVLFVL